MPAKVRKAVFPAAGLGTRFLPATKPQPKELLPLVDKPMIQYGVEEALHSGHHEWSRDGTGQRQAVPGFVFPGFVRRPTDGRHISIANNDDQALEQIWWRRAGL